MTCLLFAGGSVWSAGTSEFEPKKVIDIIGTSYEGWFPILSFRRLQLIEARMGYIENSIEKRLNDLHVIH